MKKLSYLTPALAFTLALPLAPALALDGHNEMASEEAEEGVEEEGVEEEGQGSEFIGWFAGSYACQDGEHGLLMELTASNQTETDAEVSGILGFVPTVAGQGGSSANVAGSFTISGTLLREGMLLSLKPDEWIQQPEGYGAAEMKGTLSRREDGLLQIIGKPVVPGAPTFCTDLIATEVSLGILEEETAADEAADEMAEE